MNFLNKLLESDDLIPPLILRVALGIVILPHGAQKLLGWFGGHGFEDTLGFFTQNMGVPMVIAFLVIMGEFFGAIGLIIGFMTRFCAASISMIMLGAMFMAHWNNGFFMNWSGKQAGEGFEYHILAIGMAAALVVSGGGKLSFDKWILETFFKRTNA
ncbi:MAG: DoxX family protein [Candidatus Nitrohelix vancouverensis]|uniref:DoxX family protein n=1 Tax=Candidatus Nitrohelix vancouverensis TaxID=2705534 RepID=A0A7T0C2P9_9BACT|nr:MAG: DoxX family protein [Candidatus Nitrohelix vancouverensis]